MQEEEKSKKNSRILILAILAVLFIWLSSGGIIYFSFKEDPGKIGDMFGAVNALFSGLALVFFIYAVVLQKIEIKNQLKELEFARKEYKGQKEALQAQYETMHMQRAENTFFQLLSYFEEISNSETIYMGEPISVEALMSKVLQGYLRAYEQIMIDGHPNRDSNIKKTIEVYIDDVEKIFAGYFSNLETILLFIDENSILNKKLLVNILNNKLSIDEKYILMLFCYSSRGSIALKRLVEQYGLLSGIWNYYQIHSIIEDDFDSSAFIPF